MKKKQVTFPCGTLELEGIYFSVQSSSPVPAVVVCHPHPLYGGSMYNNVTFAIAEALVADGIAALLFNFRGVGGSSGAYCGGVGEQEDVRAALDYLQMLEDIDQQKLGLAGYSFGGGVVLPVACEDGRVAAFALISPYVEKAWCGVLGSCNKPKLVIGGTRDDIATPDMINMCAGMATGPNRIEMIDGADHFWTGYESRMAQIVADFFSAALRG